MTLREAFEEWKPVSGYEGIYEVSSHGRVRSYYNASRIGRLRKSLAVVKEPRLVAQCDCKGYLIVRLSKNGVPRTARVHTLVAAAFLGPKLPGMSVNHKDGVKTNNHVDNLEYMTLADNNRHAALTGLTKRGSLHHRSKLTEAVALEIHEASAGGASSYEIGRRFGVNARTVRNVLNGVTWRHVKPPELSKEPS